jgi:hypothetical protein
MGWGPPAPGHGGSIVTSPEQDQQPTTIGRRRLVRTGAALAWTVPAISLATAVPAFAGSGCCNLSVKGSGHWRANGLNYIDLPLDVTNGCSTPVTGLTVVLTVCGVKDVTYAGTEYLPAGWTQLGKPNKEMEPDKNGCFTLTFLTAMSVPGNTTTHPQLTVKSMAYVGSGNHRPAATVTVNVSTAGCSAPTQVVAVPKVG